MVAFIVGFGVAVITSPAWYQYITGERNTIKEISLPREKVDNVLLYGGLENGFIVGKVFNRNPHTTITKITIEVIPKDKQNIFLEFIPRFFNINLVAKPRTMSHRFKVETGALNPESFSLKISEAEGWSVNE